MKEFDKLLEKYYTTVTEQDAMGGMGPDMPAAPPPQAMGGPDLGAAQPGAGPEMPDEDGDGQETEPLTSEGEVMLVRLLKKALVMKPDDSAMMEIDEIGDVNEKNAKDSLKKIVSVMKRYSTELDIEL